MEYPPQHHFFRDLRLCLTFQGQGRAVIRAPVVPEIRTPDGSLQVGAVAAMIDVLAGALTARAVYPDWMATASLSVHLAGRPTCERIAATGKVIRAGRTMAIIDVDIGEEGGDPGGPTNSIGTGLITFDRQILLDVIAGAFKPKFKEMNEKAFLAGEQAYKDAAS